MKIETIFMLFHSIITFSAKMEVDGIFMFQRSEKSKKVKYVNYMKDEDKNILRT